MTSVRASHTTQQNKARCLAYGLRSGGRCGRVAKVLVIYDRPSGRGSINSTQPMCRECAEIACHDHNGRIVEEYNKGATVHHSGIGLGTRREYTEVK